MVRGIYQVFVYKTDEQRWYFHSSDELLKMFQDFKEVADRRGQTYPVQGLFKFTVGAKGDLWIQFMPVHPDLDLSKEPE